MIKGFAWEQKLMTVLPGEKVNVPGNCEDAPVCV
jgi:hypothetical protein